MCTLAWGRSVGGMWACFNRDEQRSRPRAELPAIHRVGGHPVIFARDPVGGGTWFGVSAAGYAVALLNHYPQGGSDGPEGIRSRGQLVLRLLRAASIQAVRELLTAEQISDYAPFCLFALSVAAVHAWEWDGAALEPVCPEPGFWTTSSFRPDEIAHWRRRQWETQVSAGALDGCTAARLMRETLPENPACGLTMDREDARTLSQIELEMTTDGIVFLYRERDPHGDGFLPALRVAAPFNPV